MRLMTWRALSISPFIQSGCFGEISDCTYSISDKTLKADRPGLPLVHFSAQP